MQVTHCPGSTINDLNMTDPQSGLHPQVANPGIPVTQHTENNPKLVSYYLKYRKKTSRVVTLAHITLSIVHELREHHDSAAHKDV